MNEASERKRKSDQISRQMMRMSGMGLELVGAIIVLTLAGWGFDRWQGTSPTGTLVGALLGLVGGGYNFWKEARRLIKANSPSTASSRPRQAPPGARPADLFERRAVTDEELAEDDGFVIPSDDEVDDFERRGDT
ncbi:MAG: AtpZ/AtpI family protein [Planctomycetota bacterium]